MVSIWLSGNETLALASAILVPVLLFPLHGRRATATSLYWVAGHWYLRTRGQWVEIEIQRGAVQLQWLVYLRWRAKCERRCGELFLFRDSVSAEQWRCLRARLTLAS